MDDGRTERIRRLARESVLSLAEAESIYDAAGGDERLLDIAARMAGLEVRTGQIASWFRHLRRLRAREVPS